jgi:uncharacterized membrane protein
MNEAIETFEYFLLHTVNVVTLALEFTAVICIVIGFFNALLILLQSKKIHPSPLYNRLRLKFGGWLALALEFQLASDILKTTVAPTYENLIQLGAIAAIRTFLNYFLSKELKELPELIKQNLDKNKIEAVS